MSKNNVNRGTEREAINTLLALGCVEGKMLPDWLLWETMAACFRVREYDVRSREDLKRHLDGRRYNRPEYTIKELCEAVRGRLKLPRLPPKTIERIERDAHRIQSRVQFKKKRTRGTDYSAAATREAALARLTKQAFMDSCYLGRLKRGAGKTTFKFSLAKNAADVGLRLQVMIPSSYGHSNKAKPDEVTFNPKSGQVNVNAEVTVAVEPAWYGRVYRRGIAVVEKQLILGVEKVAPLRDGREVLRVRYAAVRAGFQAKLMIGAVLAGHGSAVFMEQEAAQKLYEEQIGGEIIDFTTTRLSIDGKRTPLVPLTREQAADYDDEGDDD